MSAKTVRCKTCQCPIKVTPESWTDKDQEPGIRKSRSTRSQFVDERPYGILTAAACIGVLFLLNLWVLLGADDLVWKLIAVLSCL